VGVDLVKDKMPDIQPTVATSHEITCTCVPTAVPIYLWIHLPYGPARIITFPDARLAYTYATNYITSEIVDLLSVGESVCDISYDMTLCSLTAAIEAGTVGSNNGHWMIMSTDRHQMLVGLGTNVPAELCHLMPNGYTLEAHDQMDDMPPLVYPAVASAPVAPVAPAPVPALAPAAPAPTPAVEPESLSILTQLGNWIIGTSGAKSPRLNDETGFGKAV
jgi:hypothetical protein